MRIGQPAAVEQVRRDCREVGFLRLAVDVGIGKQPLFPGRRFPFVQPDNHHVNVRLATRIRTPSKRAVSKGNVEAAAVEQDRPKLRHLLALRNGISRHKPNARVALLRVLASAYKPSRHVVEGAAAAAQRGDLLHPLPLLRRLELRAHKRRIAKHIRAFHRRQQLGPVHGERVRVADVRRLLNGDARIGLAKL